MGAVLRTVAHRRAAGVFLHLGAALVAFAFLFNAACGPKDGYLRLRAGQTGVVKGAVEFTLTNFRIDRWPDTGGVRQYVSAGVANGAPAAISVNHPLRAAGWWLYQYSCDSLISPHDGRPVWFTTLLCVKDVGLPFAALGGALLLLGALLLAVRTVAAPPRAAVVAAPPCAPGVSARARRTAVGLYALAGAGTVAMLVHRGLATGHPPLQNLYEFLMCVAALIPALTCFGAVRDGENTLLPDAALLALTLVPVAFAMDGAVKRLAPALQSPFFVPHVGAYVIGYVLLVRAALGAGRRFVGVGFFLLTAGMALGALWGKMCWGHWWQFDPKETWSLATWLVYAAYFHVRHRLSPRADRAFLAAGAVMIVLTLTWINLSRVFAGLHSYA